MQIASAEVSDAILIHDLMRKAFMEFKDAKPPSSALDETVESLASDLKNGGKSLISYVNNEAVGMVRFRLKENTVYFYRLSVIPEKQGQGLAKKILKSLEDYAKQYNKATIQCKVRMDVSKNIKLYRLMGYNIFDEEVVHKPNDANVKAVSMEKKLY